MELEYTDWDRRWLSQCFDIGDWSKLTRIPDPSRGVGAIIVGPDKERRTDGYNGFPRGIDDNNELRWTKPARYEYGEHAERNAVYNAARVGIPIKGCSMYSNLFPCHECARAIIQSGIVRLVSIKPKGDVRWDHSHMLADEMLSEAMIQVVLYDISDLVEYHKRTYRAPLLSAA